MRVCYDCGYRGPERACPHDGLPTFDEGGSTTLAEQPDLIGRVFADRYEVVDVLGGGGMGVVFLARHRAMQQDVALKVLKKDIANHPGAIKRFFREARLSAQLSHPNTIRVYDFGASQEGQLYLAMEYLQGRTLGAVLREDGRLPPARAINIARQICAALDAAHGAEMVHRDLKPDNIFLTSLRNAPDFVKVLDFGIAKPVGDAEADRAGLTHTGLMVGTPRYMSPEQAQGLPIDGRSDLYALGVLLYEILTGVVPFDAPTPVALLVRHVYDAPPPLPERIGAMVLPLALRQLVTWLLEKDPNNRPQSAAEVEDALVRIGAGGTLLTDDDHTLSLPVVGPPHVGLVDDAVQSRTTAVDLGKRRLRRRVALGVAGAALGAVLVFALSRGAGVAGGGPEPPAVRAADAADAGGSAAVGTPDSDAAPLVHAAELKDGVVVDEPRMEPPTDADVTAPTATGTIDAGASAAPDVLNANGAGDTSPPVRSDRSDRSDRPDRPDRTGARKKPTPPPETAAPKVEVPYDL